MPHNDGIHHKEASPWQPESVFLGDEWRALEVEGYGYAPIGHQVKTGTKICTISDRMTVDSRMAKMKNVFFSNKTKVKVTICNACNLLCADD